MPTLIFNGTGSTYIAGLQSSSICLTSIQAFVQTCAAHLSCPRSSTQGLLLRPCLAFPIFSSQATGSPSSRPLPPTWLSVPREGTVREIAMTQFCFLYFLMFPASLCFSLSPSVSVAWAWQSLSRTLLAPESLLNLQTCN